MFGLPIQSVVRVENQTMIRIRFCSANLATSAKYIFYCVVYLSCSLLTGQQVDFRLCAQLQFGAKLFPERFQFCKTGRRQNPAGVFIEIVVRIVPSFHCCLPLPQPRRHLESNSFSCRSMLLSPDRTSGKRIHLPCIPLLPPLSTEHRYCPSLPKVPDWQVDDKHHQHRI